MVTHLKRSTPPRSRLVLRWTKRRTETMILSYSSGLAVCLVSKTGTTSLTSMLCQRLRTCTECHPIHRPTPPPEFDERVPADRQFRVMTVRHPLDRWCSIYFHMLREKGRGARFADPARGGSLDRFAEEFLRYATSDEYLTGEWRHETWSWTWPFWRYVEAFRPHAMYDLTVDDGEKFIREVVTERYGWTTNRGDEPSLPHLRNSHKVRHEPWWETIGKLSMSNRAGITAWAESDLSDLGPVFGYKGYDQTVRELSKCAS